MQKKKLDSRIPTLIANGVQSHHRNFFVIVGDKGRESVVTLHFLLSKARISARPSVLWCYKKELGFTSHRKKRMNLIKKQIARGTRDADEDDPFDLFISSTNIRYTYYKETDKILGQTFGMCVLQDFEALTPNLLARTIETVEGGGIVVILLKSMNSLKQLYTMTMDVHSRYRTDSHQDTVARFNERFILSLGGCETCLVVDDELNVLPLSAGKNVKPLKRLEQDSLSESELELMELKKSMADTQPAGSLVSCAKTLDQAKAILNFIEAIAEKTLKSTVTLTASRGRGKSAALGLAIASAVAYGYSNIFITSPSPENLKTLFEFVFKGFDSLGFQEHMDYDIIQSMNPAFQKAVVRVNIFRDHRQTIQWIQPNDYQVLSQAELLVIDEAAAIPLPTVKKLLGPYLVFMASTINGYEGTGRSLSLKLIQQLRQQSSASTPSNEDTVDLKSVGRDGKDVKESSNMTASGRTLKEIKLEEPIRYGVNDPVESWLNKLLCLDCCTPEANKFKMMAAGCPHPTKCELYYVNRDTLFSYHPVSEAFLQKMMSLYVASHYKNSPNDLQLLSDAPAHHLFVLLPPISEENASTLPEPLCVVQVSMEGEIAKASALSSLSRGVRASGDLIPWVVSQQFQDDDFATLSGARVVRIATHPDYIGMGYGAKALEQLNDYYSGKIQSLSEDVVVKEEMTRVSDSELENTHLASDKIQVRDPATMPPLLLKLSERPPKEFLHWLGVSYGLTPQLHKFWKRAGYTPVYLRQTTNELTGEHTCIMLKSLERYGGEVKIEKNSWLSEFSLDFKKRFLDLLSFQFKSFTPILSLSVMESCSANTDENERKGIEMKQLNTSQEVYRQFTPFDVKRMESYAQNLLDYHVILDLIPTLAKCYFMERFTLSESDKLNLSTVQAAILVGIGLQKKSIDELEIELQLPASQLLAMFAKMLRKVVAFLKNVLENGISLEIENEKQQAKIKVLEKRPSTTDSKDINDENAWDPLKESLDEDLEKEGRKAMEAFREKQREIIQSMDLSRYAIGGTDEDWEGVKVNEGGSRVVSIKNMESTKKRKIHSKDGTAAELLNKHKGDSTGVYDPKGLVSKKHKKKSKKH